MGLLFQSVTTEMLLKAKCELLDFLHNSSDVQGSRQTCITLLFWVKIQSWAVPAIGFGSMFPTAP